MNYSEYSLICYFYNYLDIISIFASLIGIPTGIKSSAIGLKICETAAGIKNRSQWLRQEGRSTIK